MEGEGDEAVVSVVVAAVAVAVAVAVVVTVAVAAVQGAVVAPVGEVAAIVDR
jgi:hypothetical protein